MAKHQIKTQRLSKILNGETLQMHSMARQAFEGLE